MCITCWNTLGEGTFKSTWTHCYDQKWKSIHIPATICHRCTIFWFSSESSVVISQSISSQWVFTFVRFEVLNPLYQMIQVFWDLILWWWACSSQHFEVTQNLHLQCSKGTRRVKKPRRIQSTVSVIYDIVIVNLREGHICIKFQLNLWKTALKKLETQSGFPVMTQTPNSTPFLPCTKETSQTSREHWWSFLTVGALPIKNLSSQARQLAALLVGVFTMYETARPPKEHWWNQARFIHHDNALVQTVLSMQPLRTCLWSPIFLNCLIWAFTTSPCFQK